MDGQPGAFDLASGPFTRYRRTVTSEPLPDGGHRATESVDWELAIPIWGALFRPMVKRRVVRKTAPPLRQPDDPPTPAPWWSPPERLDARQTQILSRLCGLTMLTGYLGTILTQTITYARDDFGASAAAAGNTLAAVRFGVILSLVVASISDRRGRRALLRICAVGGAIMAINHTSYLDFMYAGLPAWPNRRGPPSTTTR